jgi:ligand-binding sensor domain-containing protein/two-component sensor histidine kinase
MRGLTIIILFVLSCQPSFAQQGFAFTHINTEDGIGLASNLVTSLYQDEKGFIWVGTANGLQRFDGSKFIGISTSKTGSDNLEHSRISQIIPTDSGKLVLAMFSLRQFGLFDPATFIYRKIAIKAKNISPRSELRLWKDSRGEIYLNVQNFGILHYNKQNNTFIDDKPFPFPAGWTVNLLGVYENESKQQYWFACDSGLCIYDKRSRQMWYKKNNPLNLQVLKNEHVQDGLTQVYIDKQERIWLFGYPSWGTGGQYKFCLDRTGSSYLYEDTIGLNQGIDNYTEYKFFKETKKGELWIYGLNVLLNYDKNSQRFRYIKSSTENRNISIDYESVFQVLEDKDGNIWIATNQGIYYTATGSANSSIINLTFNTRTGPTDITDVLEAPDGQLWFTSWRTGVTTTDQFLRKTQNEVYHQPPPIEWSQPLKAAAVQAWSICRQSASGKMWIGCNNGVVIIHDPLKKTSEYLHAPEFNNSTIRYIEEDQQGQMWFGTAGGRLIKWSNNKFIVVHDIGTIIFKILFDNQGWLWMATRERGLYAVDVASGKILQHYTAHAGKNSLYSNTGTDVEQLQNNVIVFGGGALNFINKNTGAVTVVTYDDGLPSNTVSRLRMDEKGFLWIITSNGLCRYNPNNQRITPYDRKDGVVLAEQTIAADYRTSNNNIIFAGSNSVVMFNPTTFATTLQPPDVTITDFKIYNRFLPVDSLLKHPYVTLQPDENSLSIYFASLSYKQKDKLTFYYKMEGIDKDWIKADRSYFVNYSLLPPGKYSFKIYCENIEGLRSLKTTGLTILIKPPYYKTFWFMSCILFVIALLIYAVHDLRVNRLMAVEALRNRVARDLHDDMGSTLSTINILSSMAKHKVNEDAQKTNEYLVKISEYSERMMDAMDDIVWSIKPSNDSMQKITARMREFATNVLEAKEIEFEFKIDEAVHEIKLNMEARRDFFLVFKEAVNNAAKYSNAAKVWINLTLQNKGLTLLVKDDGVGFNLNEADGNGLGNMQKRADNMNGTVVIKSKKGEGTAVKLLIPIS